jgi:hypothetical protein
MSFFMLFPFLAGKLSLKCKAVGVRRDPRHNPDSSISYELMRFA